MEGGVAVHQYRYNPLGRDFDFAVVVELYGSG